MATTTLEACNSRKRNQKIFGFQKLGIPGSIIDLLGPFRENIRSFLHEYGEIDRQHPIPGCSVYSTLLVCETSGVIFPLYTIEESIQHSLRPFCKHCKCVGWSNHFVSKRRYHFIIPSGDELCKSLKENWLELETHILHGLIHCNGFGHLLCINQMEIGSSFLCENDIMNLWDRICTSLQTRKISVTDTRMKKSMELRLIHGVAYRNSWFGKWGYKFGHGSFGVTEYQYDRAIQFLSTLNLDKIIDDFGNTGRGRRIERVIGKYREASETQLITMSDLLRFMFGFKSSPQIRRKGVTIPNKFPPSRKLPKHESQSTMEENPMSLETFMSSLKNADCRWPQRKLSHSLDVILKLLRGRKSMSRQELRETARQFIGDTGLIDFVLKSINCLIIGNEIICRVINPSTKLFEFEIHVGMEEELESKPSKFASSLVKLETRWPEQRLEQVARVIVDILKLNKALNKGNGVMSRQELRDAVSKSIGDTGLIDFVLKSINKSIIGNQIVCRSKNTFTRLIEFTIRDENVEELGLEEELGVYEDVLFLYKNVLLGYSWYDSVSLASRILLNSKHFVKEWDFKLENDQLMTLTCRVLPSFEELETELTRPLPPGELVMVPPSMTISELKLVAQWALRDTYCVMRGFEVRQIGGLKGIQDDMVLSCAVESGAHVWVRGCGLDLGTALRYEGGPEDGRVDCECGAKDDDGERMVGCDDCHVSQHTRCSGIDDDDELVPSFFLCTHCRASRKAELLTP